MKNLNFFYGRFHALKGINLEIPDKKVTAFIVSRPGQHVVTDEVKSFLKTRLSPFKVPKEYIVLEEMPKSPAGKILKRELRKIYSK